MDNNTIPSRLGQVSTIPASLGSDLKSASATAEPSGIGGLIFKLILLAATVGLAMLFAR